ncbi:MAG: BatA domain-containing protein [Thermoguttaceae bacterium]|jgi:hypothetical protein
MFTFAHLPMLAWCLAAAAPLLIHLWSRRKHRETAWAAMEFLLAAVRRQSRRLRLEQLLLLVLRTLLILLVVLAVAEPYAERFGLVAASGARTHRVLVLDASYSMAYRQSDKSRFELAKETAARIVERSPQGDAFTLVLMAAPPRVVVGNASFEPGQMRTEIEGLDVLHTGADLPATVAAVRQLVETAQRDNPRLARHEVYFLSDLQRASWLPQATPSAWADFRRQSEELAQLASLVVVDLGQPSAENLAVTRLEATEPLALVGRSLGLAVDLKNFGRQTRNRQSVQLLVDGRRAAQQVVDVPAGGQSSLVFSYRFETAGDHTLEVRAEGDGLTVDDRRWLVVPVRQSIRALCINGRPSGEPFHGATDYLAAALAPESGRGEHGPVEVDVAPESALLERDLGGYDCVLLANVAQFTASEARVLEAYLNRAGSLVFFLGDQVLAERYNRELGDGAGGRRILPATIGPLITQPQSALNPLGYRHPIVAPFKDREKSGLLTTPVDKYFKLQPQSSTVVLAFNNGDPLVLAEPVRRGRVVLVATSADKSWTALPLWTSYVPLVHEILMWCASGQFEQSNVQVGEPLAGSVSATAADSPLSIVRPDGQTRRLQVRAEGESGAWTYGDTMLSGLYTVRSAGTAARGRTFAVNVNTAESDLTQLGFDELQSEVWPGIAVAYRTTWDSADAAVAGPSAGPGRLHVQLLYLVLGLLFVETYLAWRFGYQTT